MSAVLLIGLWLGLLAGLIEVAVLVVSRRADPLMRLSNDFVWMAPLAIVAVTLVSSIPGALLARMVSARAGLRVGVLAAASLAGLDLLMLVPGLSHYAAALLAVGAGVRIAGAVAKRPSAAASLVRRTLAPILAFLGVAGTFGYLSSPRPVREPVKVDAGQAPAAPRPPNVLLITLDTVRAQNLSLYGYPRQTTPNLDRFAAGGVVFDRAFSTAPWTLPSHGSLMTGRWPHELSAGYDSPLDDSHPTLAEHLARLGYDTAGFVGNLGYCSYATGLGRGFAHYEDYPRSAGQIASSSTLGRAVAGNFRLRRLVGNDQHLNRVTAEDLNRRVLTWLSDRGPSPFFVFINYFDAHEPYLPPPPFDRRFGDARLRGQLSPLHRWLWDVSVAHRPLTAEEIREETDAYDGALAYLDDRLGALFVELKARHLLDDTIVVITSDHGEELGEHGLFDHGYSLYRQELQVPLVVVMPGRQTAGRRVGLPVSLRDVPASIVDAIAPGTASPFPGDSLAPLWTARGVRQDGEERPRSTPLSEVRAVTGQPDWFPASKGDMESVVHLGFHYIKHSDGSEELYRIDDDAEERTNLAGDQDYQRPLIECRAELGRLVGRGERNP